MRSVVMDGCSAHSVRWGASRVWGQCHPRVHEQANDTSMAVLVRKCGLIFPSGGAYSNFACFVKLHETLVTNDECVGAWRN